MEYLAEQQYLAGEREAEMEALRNDSAYQDDAEGEREIPAAA